MKIIVLTGDAKTLIFHRGELLKRFAAQNLEVVAVAAEEFEHVRDFMNQIGGRLETVRLQRTGLNPFKDVVAFWDLLKLMWREKPDYIFSYAIKSVIYGSIAAKLTGVPRIFALVPGLGYAFTPDGSWKQRFVCIASSLLYSIALRCTDRVFLQNHDDEALLRKYRILPRSIPSHVTLGSGVKLDEFPFRPLDATADLLSGRLRFVFISRLLQNKGLYQLAEAAKRIKERYSDVQFDLVGPLDPSPDGVSEDQIKKWQDAGLVTYHGPTRDVRPFLQQSHAFVLPTYYREGVPRCILEAMAVGLPIVTTDAVGARETIRLTENGKSQRKKGQGVMEGENGFLVRPKDTNALADALEQLIESPLALARFAESGRRIAESDFDVIHVNSGILWHMGFPDFPPAPPAEIKLAA